MYRKLKCQPKALFHFDSFCRGLLVDDCDCWSAGFWFLVCFHVDLWRCVLSNLVSDFLLAADSLTAGFWFCRMYLVGSLKPIFFAEVASLQNRTHTATKGPKQDLSTEGLVFIEGLWWIYKEEKVGRKEQNLDAPLPVTQYLLNTFMLVWGDQPLVFCRGNGKGYIYSVHGSSPDHPLSIYGYSPLFLCPFFGFGYFVMLIMLRWGQFFTYDSYGWWNSLHYKKHPLVKLENPAVASTIWNSVVDWSPNVSDTVLSQTAGMIAQSLHFFKSNQTPWQQTLGDTSWSKSYPHHPTHRKHHMKTQIMTIQWKAVPTVPCLQQLQTLWNRCSWRVNCGNTIA